VPHDHNSHANTTPGHFYLFHLLKDVLAASATSDRASRVISVASAAHRYGRINLDDLNFDRTPYDPQAAYGQSKLANIHFANELDRRYQSQNIRAFSVHPGGIFTQITRFVPDLVNIDSDGDMAKTMKNPAQGAATQVWAATAPELDGKGGLYLDEVAEAELAPPDVAYYLGGYAAHAFDPPTEKRLWDVSLKLVGLSDV
jgi:NAD(P)-dependent dehydrogenase (short-subunit alcohol dehydrogenase family)